MKLNQAHRYENISEPILDAVADLMGYREIKPNIWNDAWRDGAFEECETIGSYAIAYGMHRLAYIAKLVTSRED